ncbi:hypothetical protein JT06_19255 [Desulfobulbus sp. Tol-SR]|jgi:hypothetical protein|nr:hypothetical protein JT06_19255 [Desulfobulbus sp. Tol-SR]
MTPYKFLVKHNLPGALLREFLLKELWSPARVSCIELIAAKEREIEKLKELQTLIEKEIE